MKKLHLAGLLLFLVFAIAGSVGPAEAVKLQDDMGFEVELDTRPQRIVSLAPSITELLFAVGLRERVVGVTEFCNFPEAARKIDKVAGYNTMSVEKIVAAKADLVLAARGNDREGLETLRKTGVKVFGLDVQSVDQLLLALDRLGKLGGVEEQAGKVKRALEQRVRGVKEQVDASKERPRVMWGYWSEPVYTAGANTMIDDLFEIAGGTNVGRLAPGAWPQVGLETLISWAPEVIITTYHPQSGDQVEFKKDVERLQATDGWKVLPAVSSGRVYYIDGDLMNRPGPRLIDALEQVAAYLHPGAAGEK